MWSSRKAKAFPHDVLAQGRVAVIYVRFASEKSNASIAKCVHFDGIANRWRFMGFGQVRLLTNSRCRSSRTTFVGIDGLLRVKCDRVFPPLHGRRA